MERRAPFRAWIWAGTALLLLFAVRFHAFLGGGVLYRRDAGFFFVPWRALFATLAREGFPFWNDFLGNGRAFAADPNAAVFWPLTPLVFLVGPTGLALVNLALVLVLLLVALRVLGLGPAAAFTGGAVLLFSGVFQSLPGWFGMAAAAAPLPLAVALLARGGEVPPRLEWRRGALAAACLAFSFLGGEPAVTVMGACACAAAVFGRAVRAGDPRTAAALGGRLLATFALAAGMAAVQLVPAAGELLRSARGRDMKPEHGALFWSVRPSRVLTLLEPRLTGDPAGESAAEFWGGGTFDAGNPYFDDLALGLVPLLLAAAAWPDRRGRGALLLALGGAVLSFGRHLPGYESLAGFLAIFRYPEKWWLLTTLALAAAAAVGADLLARGGAEGRRGALSRVRIAALVLAVPLLAGCASAAVPGLLHDVIWRAGLGAGHAPPALVAARLSPLLLVAAASLLLLALLAELVRKSRVSLGAAAAAAALVFVADGARRVAGTCPAGEPGLYRDASPAVRLVAGEAARGRFFDDAADDPGEAVRRAREAGGFDPLRPATGTLFGIRFAGENDVDRMTPAEAVSFSRRLAGLPWGREKLALLQSAGVATARAPARGAPPEGTTEIGRLGSDRILRIDAPRPEFALLGGGTVTVLERRAARVSLRVVVGAPGGTLAIARTYDPGWRVICDGTTRLPVFLSEGFLSAVEVPEGAHTVEMRYVNPLFAWGGAASLLALAGLAAILLRPA